jgi:putative aldouronate transport system substrate-binding protein
MMGIKNPAYTTIRNGKLDFNPLNPNFRQAMEYFNKLYKEGLIDPECITMDEKTKQTKGSGETAIYGASLEYDDTVFLGNAGQYEAILPPKGPNGAQKATFNDTIQVQNSMVIFKNCKDPEVLVRWMDNANSGTNVLSIYAGIRGIGWDLDEGKKEWFSLDESLKKAGSAFDAHRVTEGLQNPFGTTKVSGYTYRSNPLAMDYKKTKWTDMYRPYLYTEYFPASTPIEAPTVESKEINLLMTELDTYLKSFIADAVMKGIDDAKWTAHIKKCEDLQYKKIVDFYQKQYDVAKPKK